jgi:hypothetical protein
MHPVQGKLLDKVRIQLIEAGVEMGFGLVDEARVYRASHQLESSLRVLQIAQGVVADIERRLLLLGETESAPFQPLVKELRNEIASADCNFS